MNSNKHPCPVIDRGAWVHCQIKKAYEINFDTYAHALIVGNTGSGKTYLIKTLTAKYILSYPSCEVYVADFKGDDYSFLSNEERYATYFDYGKTMEIYFKRFQDRLTYSDTTMNRCLLVLDEWNNFISNQDKKSQEHYKKILSTVVNMGRSKKMNIICGLQRADVVYLSSRDSFTCAIGMGALSKESIAMLFHDFKDEIKPQKRGCGYMLLDGEPIKEIIVPQVKSMDKVEKTILRGVRIRGR